MEAQYSQSNVQVKSDLQREREMNNELNEKIHEMRSYLDKMQVEAKTSAENL